MTVEEIKAKHQPRQLENQVEFDAIMSDINQQQGELNRPLIDRKMEIVKQRELLNIQKQAINQQLSALSAEYQDIVEMARLYILTDCGGSFERFAMWGLIRPRI